MAVFLALPNCPCQLFEPLGMAFPHKHEVGTPGGGNPDYNGINEWQCPSKGSDRDLPVCHCEEGIGKTAEESDAYELGSPSQQVSKVEQDDSCHELMLYLTRLSARAPPPAMLTNYWLKNARTGVYRL